MQVAQAAHVMHGVAIGLAFAVAFTVIVVAIIALSVVFEIVMFAFGPLLLRGGVVAMAGLATPIQRLTRTP